MVQSCVLASVKSHSKHQETVTILGEALLIEGINLVNIVAVYITIGYS